MIIYPQDGEVTDPATVPLTWDLMPYDAAIITQLRRWIGKIEDSDGNGGPTLADVVELTEADLQDMRGIGPKSIEKVKAMLYDFDLNLRPYPETNYELPLWQNERNRLRRFGEYVREQPEGTTIHTLLHEFLIDEARKG